MYLTHVRHRIKNYDVWRAAFDANRPMLEKAGVLSTQIVQVNGDPTDITVINTWPSAKHWDDFIALHDFKSTEDAVRHRENGGVIGEPEFWGGEIV